MQAPPTIVAIGASLGGLSACRKVLWGLPKGFPAAVLIAQHRQAESEPVLAGLLSSEQGMLAIEPDDKTVIVPGQVYVAPSNYHMLVERGGHAIALSTEPPVRFARPSIDVLFESVASSVGRRGIAVVLTGASDDGAQGALSVKRAGGRVIVQTPASAESAVAPSAALARLRPDAVLDIEHIAGLLCTWLLDGKGKG
jgi:two-component system, chemotaxis family, protein-glutamate methylesterase/glutaminase